MDTTTLTLGKPSTAYSGGNRVKLDAVNASKAVNKNDIKIKEQTK